MTETVLFVPMTGDRLWYVQVYWWQYNAEDVLWNTELSGAGGTPDGGVWVIH